MDLAGPTLSLRITIRGSIANLAALSIGFGTVLLWRFSPSTSAFYPRCPFYAAFHLQCPGCGTTRALAALLHGHLTEALHWNAMAVTLFPFIAVFLAVSYYRAIRSAEFHWPTIPTGYLTLSLTAILIFAIVRDIHSF